MRSFAIIYFYLILTSLVSTPAFADVEYDTAAAAGFRYGVDCGSSNQAACSAVEGAFGRVLHRSPDSGSFPYWVQRANAGVTGAALDKELRAWNVKHAPSAAITPAKFLGAKVVQSVSPVSKTGYSEATARKISAAKSNQNPESDGALVPASAGGASNVARLLTDDKSGAVTTAAAATPSTSSPSHQIYLGAWNDGIVTAPGATQPTDEQLNASLGKGMSLVGSVTWWFVDETWGDFNTLFNNPVNAVNNWANTVSASGATPVILWQPTEPTTIACSDPGFMDHVRKFSMKNIAAGNFDAYITKWAQQIKAWDKPIYLRTMHELNYRRVITNPCDYFGADVDLTINGEVINTPADSVRAWKHVVDIFHKVGATKVKWMWSVLSYPSKNFGGGNPVTLASIYPGDSYVDWIGIECYNFDAKDWQSCSGRMGGIYKEAAALSNSKPLFVAEMGALEDPRKAGWLKEAFDISNSNSIYQQFPRVTGVMYWNDSRYSGLWIHAADSVASVKSAIANSAYIGLGGAATPVTPTAPATTDANKTMAAELLKNVLGRTQAEMDADAAGVDYWAGRLKAGASVDAVKAELLASDEKYVRDEYPLILHRAIDPEGLAFYTKALKDKTKTRDDVKADLVHACEFHDKGECH